MPSRVDCDFTPFDLSLILIFDFCVCVFCALFFAQCKYERSCTYTILFTIILKVLSKEMLRIWRLQLEKQKKRKEKKANPISRLLAIYEPYPKWIMDVKQKYIFPLLRKKCRSIYLIKNWNHFVWEHLLLSQAEEIWNSMSLKRKSGTAIRIFSSSPFQFGLHHLLGKNITVQMYVPVTFEILAETTFVISILDIFCNLAHNTSGSMAECAEFLWHV